MRNPDFAQINMSIDDWKFSPPSGQAPDHIMSVSVSRATETLVNEISVEVYDDSALIVEAILLSGDVGSHRLVLSYGWTGNMSKTYSALISRWDVDFTPSGTTLTIECLSGYQVDGTTQKPTSYKGIISDVVRMYCAENDIILDSIIETEPVYAPDGSLKTFEPKEGQTGKGFIEQLAKEAVPVGGTGHYTATFTEITESDGGTSMHLSFMPTEEDYGAPTVKKFTYIVGQDHEEVIEWKPEFNESVASAMCGFEIKSEGQHPLSNDYQIVSTEGLSANDKLVRRIAGNIWSYSEMALAHDTFRASMADSFYEAELTLLGTVDIEPYDIIEVTVLTKDGFTHHSTGVYTVYLVEDEISGGSFTTTLSLTKGDLTGSYDQSLGSGSVGSSVPYERVSGYTSVPADCPDHNIMSHVGDMMGVPYSSEDADSFDLTKHMIESTTGKAFNGDINDLANSGLSVEGGKDAWQTGDILLWEQNTGGLDMSYSGYNIENSEAAIWNYLISVIGNPYGVAGLMGNLFAESGYIACRKEGDFASGYQSSIDYALGVDNGSISKEDFMYDKTGFGLAQWTYYSLKGELYDYAKSVNKSVGNLGMQLEFLVNELQNDFPAVWDTLVNATSVKEASDKVLHDFENPSDQSSSVEYYRADMGTQAYNRYLYAESPDTSGSVYTHSAVYLGNGYVFQTSSSSGASHIAKLTTSDINKVSKVVRIEGMNECDELILGAPKSDNKVGNVSDMSDKEFEDFCDANGLYEAKMTTGLQRSIVKAAVLGYENSIPYYWAGGHWSNPVQSGWSGNDFGANVAPDSSGRDSKGLDCSGFTGWVYLTAYEEQGIPDDTPVAHRYDNSGLYYMDTVAGAADNLTKSTDRQVGDYITYSNYSHAGIYVGNGKVIHCSSGRNKVVLDDVDSTDFRYYYRG